MRNPLHYSAELLVQRAMHKSANLNIPKFDSGSRPTLNDQQINQMMTNIESYPEEQRNAILETINLRNN